MERLTRRAWISAVGGGIVTGAAVIGAGAQPEPPEGMVTVPGGTFLMGTSEDDAAVLQDPAELRTLDALHTASAALLGAELDALVTYDERMAVAATAVGIPVVSPGSTSAASTPR